MYRLLVVLGLSFCQAGWLSAEVIVETTFSGGVYTYSYRVHNSGSTDILGLSLDVFGSVTSTSAPTGWDSNVTVLGSESIVQWISLDESTDVTPLMTVVGFSIKSTAPPGSVSVGLLDENFDLRTSSTTGPSAPVDTKPPQITPPSPISIPATEAEGATGRTSAALAAFLRGGSATDDTDPSPVRLAPQIGEVEATDSTLFPVGPTTVTFRFRDAAGNIGTATSTVTVTSVNHPPVLGPISNQNVMWGSTLTFSDSANDVDGDALTFRLNGAPTGASINPTTGAFVWTPTSSQIGTSNFTVRVTDNGSPNLFAEQPVTVTVGRRTTALVYSGASSGRYSDSITLKAQLSDNGGGSLRGQPLTNRTISFTIGTQSVNGTTDLASGVAQASLTLNQASGTLQVISSFNGDTLYLGSRDQDPFQITSTNAALFVPVVLSSTGLNGSFFTSELTLVNRGTSDAVIDYAYTPALGSGAGTASDTLPAGKQRIVPDGIKYLRSLGIPIPASDKLGGTLTAKFSGLSSSSDTAIVVRTTTAVPGGRAGLAYAGIPNTPGLTGPAYITGLRQSQTDRSNLAIQNLGAPSEGNITLKLTVFSGDSAAPFSQALPDQVLAPGGFVQISGVLASNGLSLANGYVRIDRISGTAPYYAYGVINDQANSDGSFVPPILESSLIGRTKLTLPVVVEANAFSTELVVTNWSSTKKILNLSFVADAIRAANQTASFPLEVNPSQQLILPNLVQRLRDSAVSAVGPRGPAFAGALFVEVSSGDLSGIAVSARTSSPGGGGRYGLFYSAVPSGSASTTSTWLYGLQQNSENRTNLALVNTGETDANPDVFRIEFFDGNTGQKVNTIDKITVSAKHWKQIDSILTQYAAGTKQEYAHITRTSGSNSFIAYAVINDGGKPGERSGDGAFIASSP